MQEQQKFIFRADHWRFIITFLVEIAYARPPAGECCRRSEDQAEHAWVSKLLQVYWRRRLRASGVRVENGYQRNHSRLDNRTRSLIISKLRYPTRRPA